MVSTNLIILVLAAAAIIYILFKIGQKIVKGILMLLIAALAFYFWQGGTVGELKGKGIQALIDQSSVTDLYKNNCETEDADRVRCLCIIEPLEEDLSARLTQEEKRTIDFDSELIKKEIGISFKNKQKEMRKCILNKKGPEYWDKVKGVWEKINK